MSITRPKSTVLLLALASFWPSTARAIDPADWPTYNRDFVGWRHNPVEKTLSPATVGGLVEKWRFPAKDSKDQIGVVHGTPIVVDGYVYFGTTTDAAVYKLTPDGKVRWTFRKPLPVGFLQRLAAGRDDASAQKLRFQSQSEGVIMSPLVTEDSVFFGDLAGRFFALDRATGKERWMIDTRAKPFPDPHAVNMFFASPIMAEGRLIVAGGTLEQVVSAIPFYRGNTGRGYVMALEPKTGRIVWKYDLGPRAEKLDPPIVIEDSWGKHAFHFGPATSSIWSTPSFDPASRRIFFGTDVNTAPRRPTSDDPKLYTKESCAIVALGLDDGKPAWITQINPDDVWTNAMRAYDPKTGRYKDQAIGDTPKVFDLPIDGKPTRVVGAGCKNGGFYVLSAADGKILASTPIYTGPPTLADAARRDPRVLALPSPMGGLQSGCATDGTSIFTNGIDAIGLATTASPNDSGEPPTGGRVVALSKDLKTERWRHERPKVAEVGGPAPKRIYRNVGDAVASGVASANGVLYFTAIASGRLVALDAATGGSLKEIAIGPVWAGPSVSRGRVYVGTGNTLFTPEDLDPFFPKKYTGTLHCFGLPGEDEVDRLGSGRE